ncbi:MAG: DUF3604 domain-containing protein, partial [Deltaproteobacteria bacterium]
MKTFAAALAVLLLLAAAIVWLAGSGRLGRHEEPGAVTARPAPADLVAARGAAQRTAAEALRVAAPKRILFGDLHVHTTFSSDAYLLSLPLAQGEGAHPPADACDFARYCSALDFWSINDHAEALTPRHWEETVESIRQCNAVAGDAAAPDVVAFLGWEWTQAGRTPETHWGHKNVVLAHTDATRIPTRPIAARRDSPGAGAGDAGPLRRGLFALAFGGGRYLDFMTYLRERGERSACPDGVPVRDLPADCTEYAETPAELFAKLRDWGHEALVIPHGTSWGWYTPAGSSWDKQLTAAQRGAGLQTLIEVYSGHGNSEEYRDYRAVEFGPDGEARCPEPSADYLPSCWRAGELIRERCRDAGLGESECETRAAEARAYYLEAGISGHRVVPGATPEDWLDAGQCRDCWLPSFNHRPRSSVQYIAALRSFDEPDAPGRFRFGFIASSDNHKARPGTGYKERDRQEMTEASGQGAPGPNPFLAPARDPEPRAERFAGASNGVSGFGLREAERQASFFLTGGLVAVHATGRDRTAIWDALERGEVYGTSGPRMLLWFDLLGPDGAPTQTLPMGSSATRSETPRFEVRAVGSLQQRPGCPEHVTGALSAERLQHLCRGECYHPSDARRRVTRIEVVRIQPQNHANEDVSTLIRDPWKVLPCEPDPAGCRVAFDDADFARERRDTLYYVRAIEAPSRAVNARNLRCEYDAAGNCVEVAPCYGDYRTPYEDDCLAET